MEIFLLYLSFIVFLSLQIYLCYKEPLCGILFIPCIILFFTLFIYGQCILYERGPQAEGTYFGSLYIDALVVPVIAFYLSSIFMAGIAALAFFTVSYLDRLEEDHPVAIFLKRVEKYFDRRNYKKTALFLRAVQILTAQRLFYLRRFLLRKWSQSRIKTFFPIQKIEKKAVLLFTSSRLWERIRQRNVFDEDDEEFYRNEFPPYARQEKNVFSAAPFQSTSDLNRR